MSVRIYLGGCIGRYYEHEHVGSVLRLLRHPEVREYRPRFNDAAVDRARSMCATEFLLDHPDTDVLLQVDSDICFAPEDAIRICELAMERDVVAGQYVTRGKGKFCYPTALIGNDRRVEYGPGSKPVKALKVAGGFHAVHRRVFERLAQDTERMPMLNASIKAERFYPFYIPMWAPDQTGELTYLSEDWALSHRAREAGFGVWVDPSVHLLHMGQHAYRLEDMLTEELPTQWVALTRKQGGAYLREAAETPQQQAVFTA